MHICFLLCEKRKDVINICRFSKNERCVAKLKCTQEKTEGDKERNVRKENPRFNK